MAPLSPVMFSPTTKILNASLTLNLQRQMNKKDEKQNNNDSVMMSTNSSSNSSTPPPSSSPDNNATDGLPSYVLNNSKTKQLEQLQPHQTHQQPVNNPLYQNIMAKLAQERLMQGYRQNTAQPLLYQQLRQNRFLNHYHAEHHDNEDEEIDVDA